MKRIYILLTVVLHIVTFTSCVQSSKLSYFNDIESITEPVINPRLQKVIMPFDKLYIRVVSIDPETNQIFNSTEELRGGMGSGGILGYLVDEGGNINFPFVGDIKVSPYTTSQAADTIQAALRDYIPNTSVSVKYVDNQVTILGEVITQGVHTFGQDKLNIYEAIGLGGGISRYGDRRKVILIRNESGKIMHYRINLSNSRIASKDTYYVLPNDVIVVEPLKAISTSYSNVTYSTVLSTITTLLAILLFAGVSSN